jgi:DNA-binding NarL/FixJ family response regulator
MSERLDEPARARILLAEDHPASADLLRALLQSEFDVVASVGDGRALLTAAAALAPDVIVTDIGMPVVDGLEAAREILRRSPDARVVFVTVDSNPEVVQRGMAMGALGYVLKGAAGEELVAAVQSALRGTRYVSAMPSPSRSYIAGSRL